MERARWGLIKLLLFFRSMIAPLGAKDIFIRVKIAWAALVLHQWYPRVSAMSGKQRISGRCQEIHSLIRMSGNCMENLFLFVISWTYQGNLNLFTDIQEWRNILKWSIFTLLSISFLWHICGIAKDVYRICNISYTSETTLCVCAVNRISMHWWQRFPRSAVEESRG